MQQVLCSEIGQFDPVSYWKLFCTALYSLSADKQLCLQLHFPISFFKLNTEQSVCGMEAVENQSSSWLTKPVLSAPPQLEVKMQVEYMSFSAHADAKGIMQLIRQAEPRNVLLVHGEAKKMEFLKQKIEQEFRTYSVDI